jgi:predicted secreted protein
MKFSSILAIYALFWSMCYFFVLPFRPGAKGAVAVNVPGQADSAPPRFSFARTCLWTTIVSTIVFGLYYINYVEGWIMPDKIDLISKIIHHGSTGRL